jgi:protein-S-isoprenylcysteine O-methyltransferase Ste14
MDFFLRIATIVLFLIWRSYWWITEKKADRERPKNQENIPFMSWKRLHRYFNLALGVFVLLQLLGWSVLPFSGGLWIQLIGFALVVVGIGSAIAARYELGINWANSYEYQVKPKQRLVTSGIYSLIRNPIYSGMTMAVFGAELVAQSYLLFIGVLLFWEAYQQSKLEEKILEAHFGKEYTAYKKRSKMLIPFLW